VREGNTWQGVPRLPVQGKLSYGPGTGRQRSSRDGAGGAEQLGAELRLEAEQSPFPHPHPKTTSPWPPVLETQDLRWPWPQESCKERPAWIFQVGPRSSLEEKEEAGESQPERELCQGQPSSGCIKNGAKLGMETHTCNPSFSGGRDQEDRGLKPALGK
jgi:hypothetical protein